MHIQETQQEINTLLETTDEDVSLGSSSESEDENAPGMCGNNYVYICTYILYVCTYVAIYVCIKWLYFTWYIYEWYIQSVV